MIIEGVAQVYIQQLVNHLSCPKANSINKQKKHFIKSTKTRRQKLLQSGGLSGHNI
jgi:hypothetical protein